MEFKSITTIRYKWQLFNYLSCRSSIFNIPPTFKICFAISKNPSCLSRLVSSRSRVPAHRQLSTHTWFQVSYMEVFLNKFKNSQKFIQKWIQKDSRDVSILKISIHFQKQVKLPRLSKSVFACRTFLFARDHQLKAYLIDYKLCHCSTLWFH